MGRTAAEATADRIEREYETEVASLRDQIGKLYRVCNERDVLRVAMLEACDLIAERKYGNPARSPGHNARLCLEAALSAGKREGKS